MIQLFLRLTARVGEVREVTEALRSVMLPARLARGCSRVELCAEVERPEVLCYLEEWDIEEEFQGELRMARFNRLLEVMECASEPPFLELRFVTARRGLEYVEAARCGTSTG